MSEFYLVSINVKILFRPKMQWSAFTSFCLIYQCTANLIHFLRLCHWKIVFFWIRDDQNQQREPKFFLSFISPKCDLDISVGIMQILKDAFFFQFYSYFCTIKKEYVDLCIFIQAAFSHSLSTCYVLGTALGLRDVRTLVQAIIIFHLDNCSSFLSGFPAFRMAFFQPCLHSATEVSFPKQKFNVPLTLLLKMASFWRFQDKVSIYLPLASMIRHKLHLHPAPFPTSVPDTLSLFHFARCSTWCHSLCLLTNLSLG